MYNISLSLDSELKVAHLSTSQTHQTRVLNKQLRPIYMPVLGNRDNPPLSYPGRANISPLSSTSSTKRLHEEHQLVSRR